MGNNGTLYIMQSREMRNAEVVEHSRQDATKHNMRIKMRKDMNHRREGIKGGRDR